MNVNADSDFSLQRPVRPKIPVKCHLYVRSWDVGSRKRSTALSIAYLWTVKLL
jgi:hypothetical protein